MSVRYGVPVVAVVLDLACKEFVRRLPDVAARFSFSTPLGLVGIVPSVNRVLAFSLPIPNMWIWPIGAIVVLALVGTLGRISNFPTSLKLRGASKFQISDSRAWAIVVIILGAISNLLDRVLRGGVTDYLAVTDFFPAFNIADLLVMGGIIGWMWGTRARGRPASSIASSER